MLFWLHIMESDLISHSYLHILKGIEFKYLYLQVFWQVSQFHCLLECMFHSTTNSRVFYTGKETNNTDDGSKKTVTIVRKLLEKYRNTLWIGFIHHSSYWKNLKTTVMGNRLPIRIQIPKNSKKFKEMECGDVEIFKLVYGTSSGSDQTAGLVAWKDSSIVYCLSNGCDNFTMDTSRRRSANGPITLPRPSVIANYNNYMGGVDLADMSRLQ